MLLHTLFAKLEVLYKEVNRYIITLKLLAILVASLKESQLLICVAGLNFNTVNMTKLVIASQEGRFFLLLIY